MNANELNANELRLIVALKSAERNRLEMLQAGILLSQMEQTLTRGLGIEVARAVIVTIRRGIQAELDYKIALGEVEAAKVAPLVAAWKAHAENIRIELNPES